MKNKQKEWHHATKHLKFNTVLTKKNTAEFSVIFSYSVECPPDRVHTVNFTSVNKR